MFGICWPTTFPWSDELYRIYELEPGSGITNTMIGAYNHPDDGEMVTSHITRALETLEPFDFYYRIVLSDQRVKTLRAQGRIMVNEKGERYKMFGTAQDVTDRQNLIEKLQESEKLYRQAETIAHIGNWHWDVVRNEVTWTDELFRMYGLEPQSIEVTYERYLEYVHPDDRDMLTNIIARSLHSKLPYEFFHRIISHDGKVKTLHSRVRF